MTHRPFRWTTFRVVLAVLAAHAVALAIILSLRTVDFLPKRRLPYIPPPAPPNFGVVGTRTEIDPETGRRVEVTDYVLSTNLNRDETAPSDKTVDAEAPSH